MRKFFLPGKSAFLFRSSGFAGWLSVMLCLCVTTGASAQALSGSYTICAKGCDYASVNDAVSDLVNNGVSGAVTMNLDAAKFNESVYIPYISGASSTNTITFKGKGKSNTSITNSSSVIYLDGTEYLIFKDMQLNYSGTSFGYDGAVVSYYSSNIVFDNCLLTSSLVSNWNSNHVTVYNNSGYNFLFENNIIQGGYYNAYEEYSTATRYANNRLTQGFYYQLYAYGTYQNLYEKNFIDSGTYNYSTGINSSSENGAVIRNNVIGGFNMESGMQINYPNEWDNSIPYELVNNLIGPMTSSAWSGIYMYTYQSGVDFRMYHNTVHMDGGNGTVVTIDNWSGGADIRNNNFTRSGSGEVFSLYASSPSTVQIDGNNYYNTGGRLINYDNTSFSDFSKFQAAAQKYGHSTYDQNVQAVYVSAGNLHYDANSPAPSGIYVGVDEDIDGDKRCVLFPTSGGDESSFGKSKPTVKFFGPATIIDGTPVEYLNSAKTGEPKKHSWYVDGVWESDSIHLYTTSLKGKSSMVVKLVTEGCAGKDSFLMTVTINQPTTVPITDFVSDRAVIRQGEKVRFMDLSQEGPSSWKWDITPVSAMDQGMQVNRYKYLWGNKTTPNNIVQFDIPGKYKVCLSTSNVKGSGNTECKVDYIEVIPSINMCDVGVVKQPSGYLFDDGGPNGASMLSNSGNPCKLLLDPCADTVYLKLNMFKTWCAYQFLRIYDGKTNKGKVLNGVMGSSQCTTNNTGWSGGPGFTGGAGICYSGNNFSCPPITGDTFIATSGKMFLEWEVFDGQWNQADGFEAFWWSTPKSTTAPVANFTAPDSVCTNAMAIFNSTSTGDEISYYWDFDGDLEYFEYFGPNANYPFFAGGPKDITLIVENCGGSDTMVKTINVFDPASPTVAFTADNLNPTTDDIVYLTSTIEECTEDFRWTFIHPSGNPVVYENGTSDISENPEVMFPETGCWTVQLWAKNVSGEDSLRKSCYITVKDGYCKPSVGTLLQDVGISKVMFGDINHSSDQAVTGYSNYVARYSSKAELGVTYKLTVERTTNRNKATRTVWIDWNGDGEFNNNDEKVAEEVNASTLSFSKDITIPTTAKVGATVMRVAINYGSLANAVCGQNKYGEYEDYRIYITEFVTPPVITLIGADTVYVEQGYGYTDSGATAMSVMYGNLTQNILVASTPNFSEYIVNKYIFSYNVVDKLGNKAITKHRVVYVTPDKTAPDLKMTGADTILVPVGNVYSDAGITSAMDLVDGDLKDSVITSEQVNTAVLDTYKVVYTVIDAAGNIAVKERTVIVADTSAPVIAFAAGTDTIYHEAGKPFTDPGSSVTDNYYTGLTAIAASSVDANVPRTYTISYTVTDGSGNTSTRTRIVIVRDTEAPVLSMNGNLKDVIEVNTQYQDAGVQVQDFDQNVQTVHAGSFYKQFPNGMADSLGTYNIVYVSTDASGNKDSVTRVIEVVDTQAPDIKLIGSQFARICRWKSYTDTGYTVKDNYKYAVITIDTVGDYVSSTLPGSYIIQYRAVDQSGNASETLERLVIVSQEGACAEYVTGISESSVEGGVSVYPNPSNGQFIVKFAQTTKERVKITVIDMLGREVKTIANGVMGQDTYTVDMTQNEAGIYTVLIQNGEKVTSHKVTIVK